MYSFENFKVISNSPFLFLTIRKHIINKLSGLRYKHSTNLNIDANTVTGKSL